MAIYLLHKRAHRTGLLGLGIKYIKDVNVFRRDLDLVGTFTLGGALTLLSYSSIAWASTRPSVVTEGMMVGGFALLVLFFLSEYRVSSTIVDLRAFRFRLLAYSHLANFLQGVGWLSLSFLLIMYLHGVRGFSPLYSSLILLLGYVVSSFLAPYMGKLLNRYGSRYLATGGLALMILTVGLYYLIIAPTTPVTWILGISALNGVGSGMF
jgi:hypothetical protein